VAGCKTEGNPWPRGGGGEKGEKKGGGVEEVNTRTRGERNVFGGEGGFWGKKRSGRLRNRGKGMVLQERGKDYHPLIRFKKEPTDDRGVVKPEEPLTTMDPGKMLQKLWVKWNVGTGGST